MTSVYVGWKISDAGRFSESLPDGSVIAAQSQLESMLRSAKIAVIGKHPLVGFCECRSAAFAVRRRLKRKWNRRSRRELQTNNYGIQLEFLGFKKIGLPESVTQTVFDRMTSERQHSHQPRAIRRRGRGHKIKSAADRQAAETVANAEADATRIRGEGEAEAAKTLPVFQQNPELANFLLRIDALQQSLNQRSTLIFDERTPPFDLFTGIRRPIRPAIDHERRARSSRSAPEPPVAPMARRRRFTGAGRGVAQQFCDCQNRDGADGGRVFLGSGFFQVGPQEKAIILRFGKPVGEGQKALLTAGIALVVSLSD